MSSRSNYKTRQKAEIIEYLQSIPNHHFTISDIEEHFRNNAQQIGQTTLYRQIEHLVDEGLVNKYIIDSKTPACFEYMGEESHHETGSCFHCKCEKCGKLIHLHCEDLNNVEKHLLEHDHFVLDPRRTVFYGLCSDCAKLI